MFKQVLPPKTQETLEILNRNGIIHDFYLSGGTCCALYLGHRISQDLDFFTKNNFSATSLKANLNNLRAIKILSEDKNTLHCQLNQTRLSFLRYKYPLVKPFNFLNKAKISSLLDVLCTKLDTISSRGSKKDFIDLYFALKIKKFTLKQIIKAFKKKYRGIDYNLLHILKSLVYFESADREVMPKMIKPIKWRGVKKFFINEVHKLQKF
jgi:hypothetical protein